MQRFWIHRRQADVEMKSGGENVENIKKHLNFAAASLGKPIPNRSRLELFASAIWQLTHQLLYRLGISRWFVNRAGGFALTEADRYVNNTICIGILYLRLSVLFFYLHTLTLISLTEKISTWFDKSVQKCITNCMKYIFVKKVSPLKIRILNKNRIIY